MNIPQDVVLASSTEGGTTFLGEDFVAWRTALVAAVVAAVIYELAMAATRKITLRLPFLILYLARITITRAQWRRLHGEWVAELHYILRDDDAPWIGRLANGLRYAIPLAFGGARHTVKAGGLRPGLVWQTIKANRLPLMSVWGISGITVQSFLEFRTGWIHGVLVALAVVTFVGAAVTAVHDYRSIRANWHGADREK